ncbi:MAG TPA: hypothetical protein VM032_20030 [Vicinamibacterales bacterium]|nr:hypothetical protein [Vicinamibacterales bacterium]
MSNVCAGSARRWCQFAALVLVLLIALPFTAPFATCDDADLVVQAGATLEKDADKRLDGAAAWHATAPVPELASTWTRALGRSMAVPAQTPGPQLFALRL